MDSVHNPDKFKNKAVRTKPSQARGKERVRVILAAALDLFREHGMEKVTTNDIAERAKIPIGSLYRYYPNKDSIIEAIIELYVEDLSSVFKDISRNSVLPYLTWEEVLTLLLDGWANHSRLNGSFAFLFGIWANPNLYQQTYAGQQQFMKAFGAVLRKRYAKLTKRQVLVCFNLSIIAIKMTINEDDQKIAGGDVLQETIGIIAAYLDGVSGPHEQAADDLLT